MAFLFIPANAKAAEGEPKPVLAYAEQEGMGSIVSYLNGAAFKNSSGTSGAGNR